MVNLDKKERLPRKAKKSIKRKEDKAKKEQTAALKLLYPKKLTQTSLSSMFNELKSKDTESI